MSLPFAEMRHLVRLAVTPDVTRKPVESHVPGEPKLFLGVPGLFGKDSNLADVRVGVLEQLPEGSEVVLYQPSTKVNLALFDPRRFHIPGAGLTDWANIRRREVTRIASTMHQLADMHEKPIGVITHSLAGPLAAEAWTVLENPEDVDALVAAGSPFRVPGIGFHERPDHGTLLTVTGSRDKLVFEWLATHPRQDDTKSVAVNHNGLITQEEGIQAIASAIIQSVPEKPQPVAA